MAEVTSGEWLVICGLGAAWLGWQIVVVAGLPRVLRTRNEPDAAKDPAAAFMRFWIDQYGFIGLTLLLGGLLVVVAGGLQ